ncbi:serine/threonine-protein phosphatase [Mycolicibacterium rufum]|uniref:Serine/threonine-protein phosphatase n=1 Tax=Mycolicibacterium rufum TaxID=318424 RepID=A0A9X2XYX2_9MYCO|nr:PP2C family protein-serine/threonine phosphatase [Mycolicibacterium rufum]KGI70423.1 serine/threonine protein phosphatase [Mycolicibacterium rufum]MCV7071237.1 serine/threonine-protein phosphatase [Mycolicibacterium rufum]ULP36748.1 serine/threonine-protein phosphatase [Mycolicibacterium rufum]
MREEAPSGVAVGVDTSWDAVPHPVVVISPAGTVHASSAAARALLPHAVQGATLSAALPGWLAAAHQDLGDPADLGLAAASRGVTGTVEGRDVEARPTVLPGGEVAWWLFSDTAHALLQAQEAVSRERDRATFLDEASTELMASLNVDRCMEATARLAARHLADAAVVVAPASSGRIPLVFCGPDGRIEQRLVDGAPDLVAGLTEALRGFPPVPSRWIDPASVPDWLIPSAFRGPVGSIVITPLPGHGVPAGALVLLRQTSQMAFDDGEEVFARLFAARAGAALSAARLYGEQAAITNTLMRDLLPPRLHRFHGIELAGGYRASDDHHLVSGDFYDVHPAAAPEDETLVVLGDVCDKGLEAAVVTGKIRNTLQALAPLAEDHAGVLRLLNSALLSGDHARFATLVLASVSRREGQVHLRLTSAGHLPPLIVRADGRVEEADTRGTLVGALPEIRSRTFDTALAPGETCLLYTDGVTEAHGGPMGADMFGEERLRTALRQCVGMPAEAVVERIMMLASQWVHGRAHDDIAVVAITAPRRTHLSAVDGHTAGRYTASA